MERIIFSGAFPGAAGGANSADVAIDGPPLQVGIGAGTASGNGSVGINLASTVAGSGTIHSTLFRTYGMPNLAFAGTLSQNGTLSLQRYIDAAGTAPQGAPITQALTAGSNGVLLSNDGHPFQSAKVTIVNGGGSTGTITNFAGVMQSR